MREENCTCCREQAPAAESTEQRRAPLAALTQEHRTTPPTVWPRPEDAPLLPPPIWDSPQWYSGVSWQAGALPTEYVALLNNGEPLAEGAILIDHARRLLGTSVRVDRQAEPLPEQEPGDLLLYVNQSERDSTLAELEGQEPSPRLYRREQYWAAEGTSGEQYYASWQEPPGYDPTPDLTRTAAELEAQGWQWVAVQSPARTATALRWQHIKPGPGQTVTDRITATGVNWDRVDAQAELDTQRVELTAPRFRAELQAQVEGGDWQTMTHFRVTLRVDLGGNWQLVLEGRGQADVPLSDLRHEANPGGDPAWNTYAFAGATLMLYAPEPSWTVLRILRQSPSRPGQPSQGSAPLPGEDDTQQQWRAWAAGQSDLSSGQEAAIRRRWNGLSRQERVETLRGAWPWLVYLQRSWPLLDSGRRPPQWQWRTLPRLTDTDQVKRFVSPDGQVTVTGPPRTDAADLTDSTLKAFGKEFQGGSWAALRDNPVRRKDGKWDHSPYFVLHATEDGVVTRINRDGGTERLELARFEREVLRLPGAAPGAEPPPRRFYRFGAGGAGHHSWPPQRVLVQQMREEPLILMAWQPWRDAIKALPPQHDPPHWYWPARPARPPASLPASAPCAPLGLVLSDLGAIEPPTPKGKHPLQLPAALAYRAGEKWRPATAGTGNQLYQPAGATDTRSARSVGRSTQWRVRLGRPLGPGETLAVFLRLKLPARTPDTPLLTVSSGGSPAALEAQGRNPLARGWQPYRIELPGPSAQGEFELTFSEPVTAADWLLLPIFKISLEG